LCFLLTAPRSPQRSPLSLHDALPISLCLSSASTRGSRPRKARNDSAAGRLPPTARISSRNFLPDRASSTPFSSKKLYASAERTRSEEHTSELQSHLNLVCRLLLEKKK